MDKILITLLYLVSTSLFSQVTLVDSHFDFGTLTRTDQNYADFRIKNDSDKEVVIFRVEVPNYVDVNFSSKTILPDSIAYIRMAYNPPLKGAFKEVFNLFLSAWDEPQQIKLTGESTFSTSQFTPCPDFSRDPAGLLRPFAISALNLDNAPIREAEIRIFKDGSPRGKYYTDQNGEAELMLPVGRYFFSISGIDTSIFVNASNDHLLAILEEDHNQTSDIENKSENSNQTQDILEQDPKSDALTDSAEEYQILPLSKFKPNNLVFLVDVSTSMKHNGKLDLLKVAMINLVEVLREVDKFTLISYASEAGVLLSTDANLNKQDCIDAISQLTAGGKTEGAKAINRAGQAARSYFINGGNNQIILATDGAFNEGARKAQKLSAKYKRKGIITTVLGIKCGKYTSKEMQELAALGGGSYVELNDISDTDDKLLEEVKIRSSKE